MKEPRPRRVGPLRALMTAHVQAAWNRTLKELGKGGRTALVLLAALMLFVAVLPSVGGAATLGYLGGRSLEQEPTVVILGLGWALVSWGGGFLCGVLGGAKALTWESYRGFPLRTGVLFRAELLAGLGDVFPLLLTLVQGAFLAGMGVARPALLPLLPLAWGLSVLGTLTVQHLVSGLAAVLVKRLQVGLVVLGLLFWVATTLGPAALSGAEGRRPGTRGRPPALELQGVQVERLRSGLRAAGRVAAWLPHGQAMVGLQEAARGKWGRGLALQAYLGAVVALLTWGAAKVLVWESQPQALRVELSTADAKLWTFRGPVAGLGRLAWETLVGSHIGKFGFLVPLMTLVLMKGPFLHMKGGELWSLPGAFLYLSITSSQVLFNQFGLYGHGVKALLLLPVTPRQLLLGQAAGLGAYLGIQVLLLSFLLGVASRPAPGPLLAALCLAACFFFVQAAVGHWTSVWMPRPMPRDSLKSGGVPLVMVLVSLGTAAVSGALFGGAYALCAWLAPALLLPVMLLLVGMAAGAYWLLLPASAEFLARRRDRLVEALG